MKINSLYNVGPAKKLEKQSVDEVRQKKIEKKESGQVSKSAKGDQVEISPEAQQLQKLEDEIGFSKELLAKLPSSRAHVIYEAIAKIKAGLYSSEKIAEEAAAKLIDSGELNDLLDI